MFIETELLIVVPELALALGAGEAAILQQMKYWLNKSNHFYDERFWIYNSYEDWEKQLPWMSARTIRRKITKLEKEGYILSANYSKGGSLNRTKWYSIDQERIESLRRGRNGQIGQMMRPNWPDDAAKLASCSFTENTTENTNNAHCANAQSAHIDFDFEKFWKEYPNSKDKQRAKKAFINVIKKTKLDVLLKAIKEQKIEKELQVKHDVFSAPWPHGSTWLRNARWEDVPETEESIKSNTHKKTPNFSTVPRTPFTQSAVPSVEETSARLKKEAERSYDRAARKGTVFPLKDFLSNLKPGVQ